MMRQMRQNTKIILWIVVIAFVTTIFAVWGMDLRTGSSNVDPNILGKVNGVPVTASQYRTFYEQLAAQYRAMSPDGQLSYSQLQMIRNQAWDNLVMGILTDQRIKELEISVTDDEIVSYLRTSPPPEIQRYFLDENGNFDYQAYQRALNNPEADWTSLENLARQRIPILKLNQYLSAQVHVSIEEVRKAYKEENVELTARYVEFPIESEDVEDYVPSDDEILAYYNDHADEYIEGEKAALEIVRIDISPSNADKEDILYTLGIIRDQILAGEDFATLAKTYSESPTASDSGATGWIGEDQREPQVFEVLASLEDGELSQPVETETGYYLVKRIGAKTADNGAVEFKAQEIFIKLTPGSATTDSLLVRANELHEKAQSVGLRTAAEEMNLEVLTPEPVYKDFPIEDLGFNPELNEFAFSNEPGTLSKVLRDEDSYLICHITERVPETTKPLEEVREAIAESLFQEHKKKRAWRKADAFFRQTEELDFEASAKAHKLEIHQPEPFRVNENLEVFGSRSSFAKTALSLEEGSISPPVESSGSYIVIQLLGKSSIDEEEFQKEAPTFSNKLIQEKFQQYITYWYEELKQKGKIEDYRNRL